MSITSTMLLLHVFLCCDIDDGLMKTAIASGVCCVADVAHAF